MSTTRRMNSVTNRTCCICDKSCSILECQCLENFQQNTSEHGNLMKRLAAAFSIPVLARDLHSFSLCCGCEHHLVVIEQANRIKEYVKQVFIETKHRHKFANSHCLSSTPGSSNRQKRSSERPSFSDSRSFDEPSPRIKRSRVSYSQSAPVPGDFIHPYNSRANRGVSLDDTNLPSPSANSFCTRADNPKTFTNGATSQQSEDDNVFLTTDVQNDSGNMDIEHTTTTANSSTQ